MGFEGSVLGVVFILRVRWGFIRRFRCLGFRLLGSCFVGIVYVGCLVR